jgi:hypothetical protein
VIDLAFFELTSKLIRIVAMLNTKWVQNSDFLAVGCGLNNCFRRARVSHCPAGIKLNGVELV